VTAKLTGFREASRQLNSMSKAMAQGVGRRSLNVPAVMLRDEMKSRVSVLSGETRESIDVGKEKTKKGRPQVNVTAADIASVQLEFGNSNMPAEPFARPSLDSKKNAMFAAFGEALKAEVDATVIRKAARDARIAAKG
jgi:HK97 gp10 family phage protein